jgi:hypothetical protein
MTPQRITLSRAKGWRMPPDTVKVDRSTQWGNHWEAWREPGYDGGKWFAVRNRREYHPMHDKAAAIAKCISEFERETTESLAHYGGMSRLLPLRGRNLACWCKPGQPCHADVLLKLANGRL